MEVTKHTRCTSVSAASVLGAVYSSSLLLLVFSSLRDLEQSSKVCSESKLFILPFFSGMDRWIDGRIDGSFSHSKAHIEYFRMKMLLCLNVFKIESKLLNLANKKKKNLIMLRLQPHVGNHILVSFPSMWQNAQDNSKGVKITLAHNFKGSRPCLLGPIA